MDSLGGGINETHCRSSLAFREKEPTAVMASEHRKEENALRSMASLWDINGFINALASTQGSVVVLLAAVC